MPSDLAICLDFKKIEEPDAIRLSRQSDLKLNIYWKPRIWLLSSNLCVGASQWEELGLGRCKS